MVTFTTRFSGLLVLGVVVMISLSGCTRSAEDEPTGLSPAPSNTQFMRVVELPVVIERGRVLPRGDVIYVRVGDSVKVIVTSDRSATLHAHTDPPRTFAVRPGAETTIRFGIDGDDADTVVLDLHPEHTVLARLRLSAGRSDP